MRLISGERGTGRTDALVRWVQQGRVSGMQRVIICHSNMEAMRLRRQYRLTDREVVGPEADLRGRARLAEVAVDNIDLLLQQRYGNVVLGTVESDTMEFLQ